MIITSNNNMGVFFAIFLDVFREVIHRLFSPGHRQCAIDEIILRINYYQHAVHIFPQNKNGAPYVRHFHLSNSVSGQKPLAA